MFSVLLGNKAKKQLKALQPDYKRRLAELCSKLEQEPVPYKDFDLRKIEGRDETYRIRLSAYRVVYQILHLEKTVWIEKIERRSETTYD